VDSDRRGQVPLLGDIPLLGFFFQRNEREKSRRELVIMIRPYVMSTPADGERISRDMLDRIAPESIERLVDEGFLPELPPPLPARRATRPAPTSAATKKTAPEPTPAPQTFKQSAPPRKNPFAK
jgi:type II secretory pathway component GspD/PulD (secretin)